MKTISNFLLLILLILLALSALGRAHEINDSAMSQLEYLYARHDDDRLVRIACSRALIGDPEGAFYLGAVFSEPESLYYKPKTSLLWLTVAKNEKYRMAETFINMVFPYLNEKEIKRTEDLAIKCKKTKFNECLASDSINRLGSIGWPPQVSFSCVKRVNPSTKGN